jgi:hypothetical protein
MCSTRDCGVAGREFQVPRGARGTRTCIEGGVSWQHRFGGDRFRGGERSAERSGARDRRRFSQRAVVTAMKRQRRRGRFRPAPLRHRRSHRGRLSREACSAITSPRTPATSTRIWQRTRRRPRSRTSFTTDCFGSRPDRRSTRSARRSTATWRSRGRHRTRRP